SASAGLLKSPQEAYNIEPGALWRHSYATALLASIIGRYGRCPALSSLYTSALLHDIGKIILNRHLQTACLNRGEEFKGGDIIQFEQTMLHTNHAKVAALLLRRWQLPEDIIAPVAHHHETNPKVDNALNCQIVYLANYLTESIGIQAMEPDNYFYRLKETDTDVPQISYFNDNIEAIITEFFEKFNESSTLEFN
ncbi:MAG TPA: HDOD domain-containing protein, partial [Desulfobacterales bacterium]|nr:HDOD domain-containing protein [Desulfobacterales bacterium]